MQSEKYEDYGLLVVWKIYMEECYFKGTLEQILPHCNIEITSLFEKLWLTGEKVQSRRASQHQARTAQ